MTAPTKDERAVTREQIEEVLEAPWWETFGDATTYPHRVSAGHRTRILALFDALLAERDALAADAKRWRFVRAVATRAPVSIDILGVHRYGVLWEAPRAMDAQMLDRIIDCAIPADNGRQQTWEVARSVVEAEGRP